MSSIRRSIAANLAGRGAGALLGLIFLPIFLRLLGPEAIGLIGFYVTLLTVVGVLELGLGNMITRETARLSETPDGQRVLRDLVRTTEAFFLLLALAAGAAMQLLAPIISHRWLASSQLEGAELTRIIALIGWTISLQLPFGLHQHILNGLEHQVHSNFLSVLFGVLRAVGALLVLLFWSRTIEAYFVTQLVAIGFCVLLSFAGVWRDLPKCTTAPVIRPSLLIDRWRRAPAFTGNAIVHMMVTQADKLILSGLLPLESFGYYVLASTVAAVAWAIAFPVCFALLPRFARLLERGREDELRILFHAANQLVALILIPACVILVVHSHAVLLVWTRDAHAADQAAAIAALLTAGTMLYGLSGVSNVLQLAAGWPHFLFYTNLVALAGLLLLLFPATAFFGGEGAAAVWLGIAAMHLTVPPTMLHRRLLRAEQSRWYLREIALPLGVAAAIAVVTTAVPMPSGLLAPVLYLFGSWLLCLAGVALVLPAVRGEIARVAAASMRKLKPGQPTQ